MVYPHILVVSCLAFLVLARGSAEYRDLGTGVHDSRTHIQRRHHDRIRLNQELREVEGVAPAPTSESDSAVPALPQPSKDTLAVRDSCTAGAWQCSGTLLQQCYGDKWNTVQTCSGTDVVCSAANSVVGCVFTWQVSGGAGPIQSPAATISSATPPNTSLPPPLTGTTLPGNVNIEVSTSAGPAAPAVSSPSMASGTSATGTGAGPYVAPTQTFKAPHYVVYADKWLNKLPSASALGGFNRFILAFWLIGGAADNVISWTTMETSVRTAILAEYHAAGIAVMITAFGSTDTPTTTGVDPVKTAKDLGAFVKLWGLDGVDIDYEDFGAFNGGTAEAWIIPFQTELRKQLPPPYLISHGPVGPWFGGTAAYPKGGYTHIHKEVGAGIDFYNIQFYNQGTLYADCGTLITSSGSKAPGTSLMEINSVAGVPLDKLVIGKVLTTADATNGGFMDAATFAGCYAQAKKAGWNGGVMIWQWALDGSAANFLKTVTG